MHRPISRLTFALSLVWAVAAHAQTVDEIVAKNLQAKGGAEKWQSVRSVKTTGKITVQGREMPLTVYARRPNLNRQEIALPKGKVVQAFDGTTAWMINPLIGIFEPQPVTGPAAEIMKSGVDFDGALINYKEKGNKIELVGKETLAGKPVYHLRVTMKGGSVQEYFLDAETGIELKTSTEVDVSMSPDTASPKQKQVLVTEMSDYKQIEGIMIPHTVRLLADGKQTMEMAITSVELNAPMEDGLFSMPKK